MHSIMRGRGAMPPGRERVTAVHDAGATTELIDGLQFLVDNFFEHDDRRAGASVRSTR